MPPPRAFLAAASSSVLLALLSSAPVPICGSLSGAAAPPQLGWRSWNAFGLKINQGLIEDIMDGMTAKAYPSPDGKTLLSLADVGYTDVGIDDG